MVSDNQRPLAWTRFPHFDKRCCVSRKFQSQLSAKTEIGWDFANAFYKHYIPLFNSLEPFRIDFNSLQFPTFSHNLQNFNDSVMFGVISVDVKHECAGHTTVSESLKLNIIRGPISSTSLLRAKKKFISMHVDKDLCELTNQPNVCFASKN